MPTLTLPVKSHETSKPVERREIVRHVPDIADVVDDQPQIIYQNFEELCTRVQKLKLKDGQVLIKNNSVKLTQNTQVYYVPKLELLIDNHLDYTVFIYVWCISTSSESLKDLTLNK